MHRGRICCLISGFSILRGVGIKTLPAREKSMTKPVIPQDVEEGKPYWAAWGNKGWSAVLTHKIATKWVMIVRVNAETNAPLKEKKCSKVKLTEFVPRNPAKKGADKPKAGPAIVLAENRKLSTKRDKKKGRKKAKVKPAPKPLPKPSPPPIVVIEEELEEIPEKILTTPVIPLTQEQCDTLLASIPVEDRYTAMETCECRGQNAECQCW